MEFDVQTELVRLDYTYLNLDLGHPILVATLGDVIPVVGDSCCSSPRHSQSFQIFPKRRAARAPSICGRPLLLPASGTQFMATLVSLSCPALLVNSSLVIRSCHVSPH